MRNIDQQTINQINQQIQPTTKDNIENLVRNKIQEILISHFVTKLGSRFYENGTYEFMRISSKGNPNIYHYSITYQLPGADALAQNLNVKASITTTCVENELIQIKFDDIRLNDVSLIAEDPENASYYGLEDCLNNTNGSPINEKPFKFNADNPAPHQSPVNLNSDNKQRLNPQAAKHWKIFSKENMGKLLNSSPNDVPAQPQPQKYSALKIAGATVVASAAGAGSAYYAARLSGLKLAVHHVPFIAKFFLALNAVPVYGQIMCAVGLGLLALGVMSYGIYQCFNKPPAATADTGLFKLDRNSDIKDMKSSAKPPESSLGSNDESTPLITAS